MRELPDPYVLAFLLLAGLALLLAFNRLLAAIRGGWSCVHDIHGTEEMLGNQYVCDSVRISFLLLVPFFALALVVTGLSEIGYVWTLVALAALWLFRKLVYGLMGWLGGRMAAFRAIERMGYAIGVLVMLACAPAILLGWLAPETPRWLLLLLLALPVAVGAFLYARRGFSLIFPTEFSLFFWVLYLCALEFLPICVVVNQMIHGN
ncbi:MAG: DUF4271 domain-containing protein [Bacteroidales bacterium]|nr:DUF4271 domain-containing protein [Bacteroidales bacterium]